MDIEYRLRQLIMDNLRQLSPQFDGHVSSPLSERDRGVAEGVIADYLLLDPTGAERSVPVISSQEVGASLRDSLARWFGMASGELAAFVEKLSSGHTALAGAVAAGDTDGRSHGLRRQIRTDPADGALRALLSVRSEGEVWLIIESDDLRFDGSTARYMVVRDQSGRTLEGVVTLRRARRDSKSLVEAHELLGFAAPLGITQNTSLHVAVAVGVITAK